MLILIATSFFIIDKNVLKYKFSSCIIQVLLFSIASVKRKISLLDIEFEFHPTSINL